MPPGGLRWLPMPSREEVLAWHWRLDDDPFARALPPADALSPEERGKAARFRAEEHRRRYVRAHLGLRALLGEVVGAQPATLAFDTTCRHCGDPQHGKPRLIAPAAADLDFSLSHADEVALLAVARGRAVGADVEALPEGMDWRDVGAFFNAAERACIEAAPQAEQPQAFLALWTRKEALLKTWGYGIAAERREVDVSPAGLAAEGSLRGVGPKGEDWAFQRVEVDGGLAATVGAEGQGWRLQAGPWRPE